MPVLFIVHSFVHLLCLRSLRLHEYCMRFCLNSLTMWYTEKTEDKKDSQTLKALETRPWISYFARWLHTAQKKKNAINSPIFSPLSPPPFLLAPLIQQKPPHIYAYTLKEEGINFVGEWAVWMKQADPAGVLSALVWGRSSYFSSAAEAYPSGCGRDKRGLASLEGRMLDRPG